MTAAAEQVLETIKTLPKAELQEVWQRISETLQGEPRARSVDSADQMQLLHSLYGRFAGGTSLDRLLEERAKDRAQDDSKLHRLSRRHA